ncbi:MAG TPA: alpha/beta hydrolase domain-containing protein, partial [Polyangiaceae bacterium]|nr:alpha/beta hydrolase domain-containing protein [Polyangiaceae bacterium]
PVDVPVDVLSGAPGPKSDLLCILLGSTTPLPDARLTALYPTRVAYEQTYDEHANQTIQSGFVLEEERAALRSFAQPSRVTP